MSTVQEQATGCAACGVPIVQKKGTNREFCSSECFQAGRSFCKACGKALSQQSNKSKKTFCNDLCSKRYRQKGEIISPSYFDEKNRSTCKACGKPLTQPKRGGKQFCNGKCSSLYRATSPQGLNPLEEWGSYAPETRKILKELQFLKLDGTAKRLAIAIDREYKLRSHDKPKSQDKFKNIHGEYIVCHCKTCGKDFPRRPWGVQSRDYCSDKCMPPKPRAMPGAKLRWEEVDEIRRLYFTEHLSQAELAGKYGVKESSIRDIVIGRKWKSEQSWQNPPGGLVKLTRQQVDEIRRIAATEHISQRKLAPMFGVSHNTIGNILNHKTWKPALDPRCKSTETPNQQQQQPNQPPAQQDGQQQQGGQQ